MANLQASIRCNPGSRPEPATHIQGGAVSKAATIRPDIHVACCDGAADLGRVKCGTRGEVSREILCRTCTHLCSVRAVHTISCTAQLRKAKGCGRPAHLSRHCTWDRRGWACQNGKPWQLRASSSMQARGLLVENTDKQELLPAVWVPSPAHCRQGEKLGNDHGREAWGTPRGPFSTSVPQSGCSPVDLQSCRDQADRLPGEIAS